ncbi:MAG: lasso peptide biosynthesis B2 protein [Novosphingobium sp.]
MLPAIEPWAARLRTLRAMALLLWARALITFAPFRLWRRGLGQRMEGGSAVDAAQVRRLAAQVERAALRLPLAAKCLPRAMALSWLLRWSNIPHRLVLAVRPPAQRGGADDLHAWVEVEGRIVLGDLPGPWLRLLDTGG